MALSAPAKDRFQLFVSYARKDMVHADAIVAALKDRDFDVRIDKRSLEPGAKWREELLELIRTADTVVWLVTPASHASKMCQWELEQCVKFSRRIVPVMVEAVPIEDLPIELQSLQFMPSIGVYDPALNLDGLVETLNRNLSWLKEGTRLADRAHQWNLKERPNGLLLSRAALKDAEDLLAKRPPKTPEPAAETLDYLLASRRRTGRMQRWAIGGSLAVAAVAGVLATIALVQRQEAVEQRDASLINRSRLLADAAHQNIEAGDAATAILLALEGLPNEEEGKGRPHVRATDNMLLAGLMKLREHSVFDVWTAAAVNAGGTKLAYGTEAGPVDVIDANSRKVIWSFPLKERLTGISFSGDDSSLVTMTSDMVIRVWDLVSGKARLELQSFSGFNSVSLSPDGKRLLLANGLKAQDPPFAAMVWDSQTRARTLLLTHPAAVVRAAFSPDGRLIATADGAHAIRVFNAATGAEIASLKGHDKLIYSLAFSADGTRLVSAAADGTARVWNIANPQDVRVLSGHDEQQWSAGFSGDGARVFTISGGTLKEWDAASGAQTSVMKGYSKESMRPFVETESSVQTSAASDTVITTQIDDTVRVWKPEDERTRSISFDCSLGPDFQVSGDGARIVTECGGKIQIWEAASGKLLRQAEFGDDNVRTMLVTPDERLLAALGSKGKVKLWSLPELQELAVIDQGGDILSGDFDVSGTRLALGSPAGVARIWDLSGLKPGQPVPSPLVLAPEGTMASFSVARVRFSPSGATVLTLSGDRTPRLWDATSGKLIWTFSDPDHVVAKSDDEGFLDCAFTPDGRFAVTTYINGEAEYWDTENGKRVSRIQLSSGTYITKLVFSADGKRLISNAEENPVTASEVPSGRLLKFTDFWMPGEVFYDPKTELMAALGSDHGEDNPRIRIMDAVTFRQIHSIPGFFEAVSLSADATRLVALRSIDNTSVLQIWDLPPSGPDRVRYARERVPRCLESLQLEQFGLDPAPPRWCITGAAAPDSKPPEWIGKWPYHKPAWRTWLEARNRGENPAWPNIHEHGPEFVREVGSNAAAPASDEGSVPANP